MSAQRPQRRASGRRIRKDAAAALNRRPISLDYGGPRRSLFLTRKGSDKKLLTGLPMAARASKFAHEGGVDRQAGRGTAPTRIAISWIGQGRRPWRLT